MTQWKSLGLLFSFANHTWYLMNRKDTIMLNVIIAIVFASAMIAGIALTEWSKQANQELNHIVVEL